MDSPKLEPGPTRDVIAALVEASRGGEGLNTHDLVKRTGVPYMALRSRLVTYQERGWVTGSLRRGVTEWEPTERGAALL